MDSCGSLILYSWKITHLTLAFTCHNFQNISWGDCDEFLEAKLTFYNFVMKNLLHMQEKNIDHFKKFFQCELNWTTLLHFQIFLCDLFFSLKKYYLFGKSLSAPWVFFPQTKQFLFNFKRDCKTTFCYSAEANANWIFVKDFEVQ